MLCHQSEGGLPLSLSLSLSLSSQKKVCSCLPSTFCELPIPVGIASKNHSRELRTTFYPHLAESENAIHPDGSHDNAGKLAKPCEWRRKFLSKIHANLVFQGVYLVLRRFREANLRSCWQFLISFYKCLHHV